MSSSASWLAIPPSRSIVCDILHFDRKVPSYSHDRICNVSELADARQHLQQRISWPAIFLKAYAITGATFPRLRQTWMNWPVPHLYQHPYHIGTLVVRRDYHDDDWLFWARLTDLDTRSLMDIQQEIDQFQLEPVESIFRRQVWLAHQSTIIRRLCWWLTFYLSGYKKCKRLGTFFLSTVSGRGAEIQHLPSMLTSGFTYGPIDNDGNTRVTITYDHRLLDGHHIADILKPLECTLQGQILEEMLDSTSTCLT